MINVSGRIAAKLVSKGSINGRKYLTFAMDVAVELGG